MEQETKEVKSFFNRITALFTDTRKINRMRVRVGTEVFWVKDKKKIKYYQNLTTNMEGIYKDSVPLINIIKVEYEEK